VIRRAHAAIQVKTRTKIKPVDASPRAKAGSNPSILFLEKRQTGKFHVME
jgi:hypothetical protein